MPNLNKCQLMGHLTRAPETRYTKNKIAVTEIGLAINRKTKEREETVFVDVTFWGKTAEIVEKYVRKGQPLFVEGRLQLDTWEDKQTGKQRSKLKVVGEAVQLLGSGNGQNNGQSRNQASQQKQETLEDDEIPF